MCGIAGKVGLADVDRGLLEAMAAALHHRGPDEGGAFVDGNAGLCMRRLAVIDPAGGSQPIFNEDRSAALVLNGEIYNHRALRGRLEARGHSFRGGSDAEVAIHLWEERGPALVDDLRGMFALAIWDTRAGTLFLARDRLGKKPLYYFHSGRVLSFASEPRALLADPDVPRTPRLEAIDAFLAGAYVPGNRSAFAGLRRLDPASTLLFSPAAGGEPRIERYWRPSAGPKLDVSEAGAAALVEKALLESTAARLESDVPLGAFLSGGLDSSAVVAAMTRVDAAPRATFAATFPGSPVDEARHARRVARHLGTDHHEIEVAVPDLDLLRRMAWHFGEPFADPAAVPTFQLAEVARRMVTVVLTGDGGDEAFAGYRRYWQVAATRWAEGLPVAARSAAAGVLSGGGSPSRPARLARRLALSPGRRYADLHRFLTDADRAALYGERLRPLLAESHHVAHVERAWDGSSAESWIDRAIETDLSAYLPDDLLVKLDITTMAHGLEARSPLLDTGLLELGLRLPVSHRMRGRDGKRVLKRVVAGWLPPEIVERPKQGFSVPLDDWLRGPLGREAEGVLLDASTADRGFIDPVATRRVLAEHAAGASRGHQIWVLLNLELWARECLDSPRSPVAPRPDPLAAGTPA